MYEAFHLNCTPLYYFKRLMDTHSYLIQYPILNFKNQDCKVFTVEKFDTTYPLCTPKFLINLAAVTFRPNLAPIVHDASSLLLTICYGHEVFQFSFLKT